MAGARMDSVVRTRGVHVDSGVPVVRSIQSIAKPKPARESNGRNGMSVRPVKGELEFAHKRTENRDDAVPDSPRVKESDDVVK